MLLNDAGSSFCVNFPIKLRINEVLPTPVSPTIRAFALSFRANISTNERKSFSIPMISKSLATSSNELQYTFCDFPILVEVETSLEELTPFFTFLFIEDKTFSLDRGMVFNCSEEKPTPGLTNATKRSSNLCVSVPYCSSKDIASFITF